MAAFVNIVGRTSIRAEIDLGAERLPNLGATFLFQGQGGFHPRAVHKLIERDAEVRRMFESADAIVRRELALSLSDLLREPRPSSLDLDLVNDVEQVGIYVEGVIFAMQLRRRVTPGVLLGHSFGEFAALAAANVVTFAAGVELVCARVRALRSLRGCGVMLAIGADATTVREHLHGIHAAHSDIAVINGTKQMVISGPRGEIDALQTDLSGAGIASTLLTSRYPFHSNLLAAAVGPFREAARRATYAAPSIALYLPVERRFFDASMDMADLLSRHLVTTFDFNDAVQTLYGCGGRAFYECAASSTLRNLVGRALPTDDIVLEGPELIMPIEKSRVRNGSALAEAHEDVSFEPMAIVGYGCVLPGALDVEHFWQNIMDGTGSVVSCDHFDTYFDDFFTPGAVVPNRTYSKLMGYIDDRELDAAFGKLGLNGTKRYAKVQKIAALALREALGTYHPGQKPKAWSDAVCYFGATPDGIKEYDDALAFERFSAGVLAEDSNDDIRARLNEIRQHIDCDPGDVEHFSPRSAYRAIVHEVLGAPVKTVTVDSACSSSLYALDMGIKAIASGEKDIAFCIGAFAPGVGNNCLFAQFKGLATTGLRAFDKAAEGTVFGDGGAAVIVRRLSDATRDGDSIYGVVRGVGMSSDGKAPAVNVPTVNGQRLAIERAYRSGVIDPTTIQYVEGHATGTAGDAIEFRSLSSAFTGPHASAEKIRLGSVKSLIGHTGWASGLASFIKLLLAFRARTIPAQHGLSEIHPDIKIAESAFTLPLCSEPWTPNVLGLPRRAGINSFGFGGTNIHMIVEDFDDRYHRALSRISAPARLTPPATVVAMNALYPGEHGRPGSTASAARFDRGAFALPAGMRVLPDVLDTMSSEQLLAVMACGDVVSTLKDKGIDFKRVGVVLSGFTKADRARVANDFIYEPRFRRLIDESNARLGRSAQLLSACERFYAQHRAAHHLTGPYTLAGIMPNIVSGRVAHMYDVNGPNLLIGEEDGHDAEFLAVARQYLAFGDADIVICGALNLESVDGTAARTRDEGIAVFCITTPAFAGAKDLDVIGTIEPTAVPAANSAAA